MFSMTWHLQRAVKITLSLIFDNFWDFSTAWLLSLGHFTLGLFWHGLLQLLLKDTDFQPSFVRRTSGRPRWRLPAAFHPTSCRSRPTCWTWPGTATGRRRPSRRSTSGTGSTRRWSLERGMATLILRCDSGFTYLGPFVSLFDMFCSHLQNN